MHGRSLVLLFAMCAPPAFAQGGDCGIFPYTAIHVEGAAAGGLGSINYERTLTAIGRARIHARVGIGTIHLRDYTRRFNPDIVLPFGMIATDRRRWNPEVGGGITLTSIVYPDKESYRPERRTGLDLWLCAGIRFVPGRWIFRAVYTPLKDGTGWRHWGGLSAGFKL
jgi:hypothetical protein